jgi:hypothetical protein
VTAACGKMPGRRRGQSRDCGLRRNARKLWWGERRGRGGTAIFLAAGESSWTQHGSTVLQKTHRVPSTNTNRLMFREIIAVYCENRRHKMHKK